MIYFLIIESKNKSYIKIGYTDSLLRQAVTRAARDARLLKFERPKFLGAIEGSRETESALHRKFWKYRFHEENLREWFKIEPDMMIDIMNILYENSIIQPHYGDFSSHGEEARDLIEEFYEAEFELCKDVYELESCLTEQEIDDFFEEREMLLDRPGEPYSIELYALAVSFFAEVHLPYINSYW